jgi:trimethylamine---corrinoid protein Co-methyltransferase
MEMSPSTADTSRPRRRKSSRQDKVVRKAEINALGKRKAQNSSISLVAGTDVDRVHDAVLSVLWDLGAIIEHRETRDWLLQDFGCVEGEGEYLRFPPDLVQRAISTVPSSLRLYDQNGNVKVDTAGDHGNFAPGHNCVRILDYLTGELRPCGLEDIRKTSRLCDALPNMDMVGSLGYPSDVPAEDESVECVRAMMENSAKPAIMLAHDEHIQERVWTHVADVAGGWDNLADKPIALELLGPVSPLRLPDEFCLRLINAARWHVPLVCYPATFPGMSSPISAAGAIVQSSAEALAGIVIHQLTQPGAPVMSGSAILPMDMRQADLAYGSPEYMLTGLGAADYFGYLGIPAWVGAGCSDSHDFDAQAAAEAGASMSIASLASTPFIHNLGYLSGGRTGSLEMLTLCDELAGWSNQMAAGVQVDANSIALEVIKRSAPENSYLTDEHTQDRFLTENWYPELFERSDADAWMEAGSHGLRDRIRQKISDVLG